MSLTKDQILSCVDRKVEEVPVPEWGGSVFIKVMTGTEREAWETAVVEKKMKGYIRTNLLVRSICDEHGNYLFTDKDVEELGKKNSAVIDRLFDKCLAISKVSDKDLDDLGNASTPIQ